MTRLEEQLLAALIDARNHLDYCGYGDSWERECAQASKLEDRIEAAIAAGNLEKDIFEDNQKGLSLRKCAAKYSVGVGRVRSAIRQQLRG